MIDIIGAGFGRTSTMSLKKAIELLGKGPCYHMEEIWGKDDMKEKLEQWADVSEMKGKIFFLIFVLTRPYFPVKEKIFNISPKPYTGWK